MIVQEEMTGRKVVENMKTNLQGGTNSQGQREAGRWSKSRSQIETLNAGRHHTWSSCLADLIVIKMMIKF